MTFIKFTARSTCCNFRLSVLYFTLSRLFCPTATAIIASEVQYCTPFNDYAACAYEGCGGQCKYISTNYGFSGMICMVNGNVCNKPPCHSAPGSFCPSQYGVASTLCGAGTFSGTFDVIGACPACLTNTFALSAGTTACTMCPAGFFGVDKVITMCPAHFFCAAGSTAPIACPANSYCLAGTTAPVPFLSDHYYIDNGSGQLPCPGGYFCSAGSPNITVCPAGSYCPAAITNMVYPIKIPIPCSYNQYCPNGSATPFTCPAYTYCPTPDVSLPCPAGATCNPTRTNLMTFTLCPAGYRCAGNRAEPVPCFAGTYSAYGSSQCMPCGSGTYSSSAGSPVCTMCPLGYTTSPMGATSLAQCACRPGYSKQ